MIEERKVMGKKRKRGESNGKGIESDKKEIAKR